MTNQMLDELTRQIMLDAARQEYGSLMDEPPEHDFSPEFERKMRKLVCRANHPVWYRIAQTAACLLLAALLSGCAVLAISPEAREVFSDWVREVASFTASPEQSRRPRGISSTGQPMSRTAGKSRKSLCRST